MELQQTTTLSKLCQNCGEKIIVPSFEALLSQKSLTCPGCGQTSQVEPQELEGVRAMIEKSKAKEAKLDAMFSDLDTIMKNREW